MDSLEMDRLFDAIYMAIQQGHVDAARRAFDLSLERAVNKKLDEVTVLAMENDALHLVDDINRLRVVMGAGLES